MKRQVGLLLALMLFTGLLAGCAPAPGAQPVVQTVVVEKQVEVPVKETVVVEKVVEVSSPVQEWELVNPAGAFQITPLELAPRISSLEGKTVGLKWNMKPNGDIFLNKVAELLTAQVKDIKIIKFYEVEPTTVPQSANNADAERKAEIIASYKPDLVIGSQCD
jgi:hypothetical protein